MARILLFAPVFLSVALRVNALATCYYPDGVTTEPGHVPCNQTISGPSACCDPFDSCSVSGICLGRSGWTYRGSCTDVTWGSGNCAATSWTQCITDPSSGKRFSSFSPIWACAPPGTGAVDFCCQYGNGSSCCASSFTLGITGVAFRPGYDAILQNLTKAEAAANSTSNSTCSSSNSTSLNSTSSNSTCASSGNGDLGTKVGLGVGIPLGVLAIGILSYLFYRETRKRQGFVAAAPAYSTVDQYGTPIRGDGTVGGGIYQDKVASPGNLQSYAGTMMGKPYTPATPVFEAPNGDNVHEMRG